MSRVYFHSPSAETVIAGSERAWLAHLCDRLTAGLLDLENNRDRLLSLVPEDHTVARHVREGGAMPWHTAYGLYFRTANPYDGPLIRFEGHPVDPFTLTLNTALTVGNDQIKLAARLHGQCELHAWVDGTNRAWLADIIQAGLDSRLYRATLPYVARGTTTVRQVDQGWGNVIDLLRSRDDEPVVTSFSVTEQFPNPTVGDWLPPWPDNVPYTHEGWHLFTPAERQEREERGDAWHELPAAEKWRISMAGLRQGPGNLELTPDGWHDYSFGHGLSVLDLLAPDYDDHIRAAVARENSEQPLEPTT